MKPRQTVKNYHNSNAPPYQHLPNSTTPPTLRDIDLVKLGLNLDDMPNLQANNPNLSNQEELVKCLQAIYGKNNATKLPSLNDWPMQSVSPSEYSRIVSGSSGGPSGVSFNDNSNNNNTSNKNSISGVNNNNLGQKQQDIHLSGSHQNPSSMNHHFRVSSSNIHSPQQMQQQKSVLSLHHHHPQNDLSNRRLNHHHMSATKASFSNLSSTVSATNATPTSNSSSSSLDTNNLNTLGGKVSCGPICSGVSVIPTHPPNIMDTLGSMDNMFYDVNMDNVVFLNKQRQAQMGHHHLQKLLKATGSQPKSSSSSSTLSHRNESQNQRNITSNNMPQSQLPISSPASTISPPQAAFTSVPKSLLNLAACSSSSPSTTTPLQSASKFSSMVSQLNLISARNTGATNQTNLNSNNSNTTSNIRSFAKNNIGNSSGGCNDGLNQKGSSNGNDHSNLLQNMSRSNNNNLVPNIVPPTTRSGMKQIQLSLLSDDQSPANRSTCKTMCNVNPGSNPKPQSSASKLSPSGASSKEAYLASIQERAARAGISIGEISKSTPSANLQTPTHNNNSTNPITQQSNVSVSPNQNKGEYMHSVDRKEIESALSRVEARNDLSLLYPPMLLASNSQKQINALSAGLEGAENSELFTEEVKKIVLEECNIIYECKECNNLFRSLANLVKHKRTYCVENSSGRNSLEMNKRSYVDPILPIEQQATTISSTRGGETQQQDLEVDAEHNVLPLENRFNESSLLAGYNNNSRNSDRRTNLSNMIRFIQNQEKKNQERDVARLRGQNNGTAGATNPAPQTSLSKLLQSQPKNRLPVSRDSALISALNATPISSKENPLSVLESDKKMNCSSNEVHEQLVRNSSLAKTLLNEKFRVTNPKQSLSEFSRVEQAQPRTTKRVAPKRKFLEDCIQKVKRDKLLTEEEDEEAPVQTSASNTNAAISKAINLQQINKETHFDEQELGATSDKSKFNSPEESGDESDMLTIDLDGPTKRTPTKKAKRRISTAASSIASSSSVKLNKSSALLKALTRPVDTKRSFNTSSVPCDEKMVSQSPQEPKEKLPAEEMTTDVSSPLFPLYTCDYCDLDVEDPAEMMDHMLQFHSKMMIIFPCLFCSSSFISMENVCRHILEIHKKPRAQINRLKEVVRSRSFESPDFSACRDCPQSVAIERADTISRKATSESDADGKHSGLISNKFEGVKTRGKKRIDYNQMINNDLSETESNSSKLRRGRTKSVDQQVSIADIAQGGDTPGKAAASSIDGDLMEIDDGDREIPVQEDSQLSMSSGVQVKQEDDESNHPEVPQDSFDIKSSADGDECPEKSPLEEGKLNGDMESDQHHQEEEEEETAPICDEEAMVDGSPPEKSSDTCDLAPRENASNDLVSEDDSYDGERDLEGEAELERASDDCDEDGDSDDDSSSSSSSSSGSSSDSSSSSSSSGSSSSSTRSSSSNGSDEKEIQNDPQASTTKQLPHPDLPTPTKSVLEVSQLSSDEDSSQQGENNEQVNATKHASSSSQRGPPPHKNNDSCAESQGIDNYSISPARASDESKQQPIEQQTKQNISQRPSSSTKSNLESTTPSSNSTGGSGGIMKLKIQLKTRPDEKSKVYEIV